MKMKSFPTFAVAFAALLSLISVSMRAGTITVVGLPPTGTDIATGITTNKTYVCAFNFGSQNTTTYSVNGVPFAHVRTSANNVFLETNWTDANPGHGGQLIVSTAVTNKGIDVASSAGQGALANQADGNMRSVLTDIMYSGNGAPISGWLQQEYDNLTIGHQYSLRIYYRYWGNAVGDRTQNILFNGEGTWQAYSGNPLDIDVGTNGALPNGLTCHGARFIEYDFTASATNVFCLASNLVANGATMLEGATLEDDSYPYAPFITYQTSAVGIGNGIYRFNVEAVGTPSLSYQWYSNSVASYSGAAPVTDGNDYSGSTTPNLTATNNLLDYYFAVVNNNYGFVTSSIVKINPAPSIIAQPTPSNVANSYVEFNVTAGGFLPLAYQWYFNTTSNYSGATALTDGNGYSGSATNSLTTTTNLQDFYFVVVTNSYGSVTSAITAYNPLPGIVTQPVGSKAGNTVQLTVTAGGWPTLGYQWYMNSSSSYNGATAMTDGSGVSGSSTPSVTVANLLNYYYVVVTNYYGSVTSAVVAAAIPLTVTSAGEPIWNSASQTNIMVTFSDDLDPVSATTLANYAINNSATISSATLVAPNEVSLITSSLTPSTSYTLTVQNVKDYSFGLTMAPSSTNLMVGVYPANLALWLRANATNVTTDSSGNVSQWNDLTANANDFYGPGVGQPVGTPNDPVFTTNSFGDPVVRFASTNLSEMGALDVGSLEITGDMSVIAVANFANLDNGTNGEIVSKTGSVNKNIPAPYDYYVGGTAASLYRGNGTSYGQFSATSGPSIGVPHILIVSESGNTVSHFLDGAIVGTGILNNNFQETNCLDQNQFVYIGARSDFAHCLSGDLSELIIADSPITSYDVAQLTPYLAKEHNVSLVNTSPTNLGFSVSGTQLTLSWPADHTGWQLQAQTNGVSVGISTNWVNVPGSTSTDSMVIPINLTNGAVFYRLIYNP